MPFFSSFNKIFLTNNFIDIRFSHLKGKLFLVIGLIYNNVSNGFYGEYYRLGEKN